MPYAEINGARLHYEQWGGGSESIVFAHGLLMRSQMYERQIAALQADYRCVAFDFRGHGRSESTPEGYSLDEFAQDAVELIRFLQCAPCHFVGHSLGGFVAMRVALRYPELVKSLVLINTTAGPERPEQIARYRLLNLIARFVGLRPVVGQVLPIMFGHDFLSDPGRAPERDRWRKLLLENDRRGVTRSAQVVIDRDGIVERLAGLEVPTLVITGSDDRAIPPASSRALHEAIAKSRFLELPRIGHTSPVEAPDAVAVALCEFLPTVTPTGQADSKPDRQQETPR